MLLRASLAQASGGPAGTCQPRSARPHISKYQSLLNDAQGGLLVDYEHIHARGQGGDVHALGVVLFAGHACHFGACCREDAYAFYSLGAGDGYRSGGGHGVDAQAVAGGVTYAGCPAGEVLGVGRGGLAYASIGGGVHGRDAVFVARRVDVGVVVQHALVVGGGVGFSRKA